MWVSVQITDGPSYRFKLYGTAVVPDLHFSFSSFDFGPSFIYRAGLQSQAVKLKITNSEQKAVRSAHHALYGSLKYEIRYKIVIINNFIL